MVHEYAYKTYEYISKLANCWSPFYNRNNFNTKHKIFKNIVLNK